MDNLKQILINLENAGIKTRGFHLIKDDIESNFIRHITLINNKRFKVEYDITKKEVIFETTYSNQPITDEYIAELMELYEMLPLLQESLDFIFQDKTA